MILKIYPLNNLIVFEETENGIITKYPGDRVFYRAKGSNPVRYDFVIADDGSRPYSNLTFEDFQDDQSRSFADDDAWSKYFDFVINLTLSGTSTGVIFSREVATLANGDEIDTGFLDFSNFGKQQVFLSGSKSGLTAVQTQKTEEDGTEITGQLKLSLPAQSYDLSIGLSFQRLQVINETGEDVDNVILEIKAFREGADGLTVIPLQSKILPASKISLSKNIGDFGADAAQGLVPTYQVGKVFGRNPDIDTGSDPEDVWNGGGDYTGFNATTPEPLEIVSDTAGDSGTEITSGTATGGTITTIEDSGADFVAAGVQVGDLVINQTKKLHGIISSFTVNRLTVYRMNNGPIEDKVNQPGDDYTVARSAGTGAGVVRLGGLIDGDYNESAEYIIMNGLTAVQTTGSYIRNNSMEVVLAGSSQSNLGQITSRQSVTLANIFAVMPVEVGKTSIACATVPAGKTWVIKQLNVQMGRSTGAAGRASVAFQSRRRGEAWQSKRLIEIQDGANFNELEVGGIVFPEFTDVKWRVLSVSDSNTIVTASFEYYEITST